MSVLNETLFGISLGKWSVIVVVSTILGMLIDISNINPMIGLALAIAVLYPFFGPGKMWNGNNGGSE